MIPITFFSGPMRSGKSTKLLSELQRNSYRKNIKVILYRPKKDTREFMVRSAVGGMDMSKINTIWLENSRDILDTDGDVIGLEELHFLPKDIVPFLLELYLRGKEIFIAGLTMDAEGVPWESTKALLCSPEVNVIRCYASCEWCGHKYATRTFGKYGNTGVGDDHYEAICFACWDKHFKEKQKKLI